MQNHHPPELPGTDQQADPLYPIQFLERGDIPALPAPLVRIITCGGLIIETLGEVVSDDPPQARYRRLSSETLRGRGIAPALTLLKVLVSQRERSARKDYLREHLSRFDEEAATEARLDDVATLLRSLLCPLPGKETDEEQEERKRREKVRRLLLASVAGSKGSGAGFALGDYPLIWVDSDALAYYATQAARMERFADPGALSFWEQAYQLASRGTYLPEEPYSEWAAERREEVEGYLRQCVHALARHYPAQYGQAGEEELQLLLRNYWLAHKTDEDALRPLMELLGKHERYGEALSYYEQCKVALAEQDCTPDARTHDLAEYLRTKQTQREHPLPRSIGGDRSFVPIPPMLPPKQDEMPTQYLIHLLLSHSLSQRI